MATTYVSSFHAFQPGCSSSGGGASPRVVTCHVSEPQPSSGRRSACLRLGLATAAVLHQHVHTPPARATDADDEDPQPGNKGWCPRSATAINNGETGTRSFVKNGSYMAHAYRLRGSAFDLLGKEASNYVNKYLRLKATFMYYDFDKLITAAEANSKAPLLDLANRLFDSFERLQQAVTSKDDADIGLCYGDTKLILQEVMTRMA